MKALLLIFSLLLVLLLAGLWVGSGSYPDRWRIDERTAKQESANKQKKAQINKIQAELDDVKSGDAAIEERARSELGMTVKGETFFEVILQPEQDNNKKKITNKEKEQQSAKVVEPVKNSENE